MTHDTRGEASLTSQEHNPGVALVAYAAGRDGSPDTMSLVRRYVERDWFVVPLHAVFEDGSCRCPKRGECSHSGKHPLGSLAPHGWKDASRYMPTIERWLRIHPTMNIGVVTGPSRLASLDIDPRNGGEESLDSLIDRHGPIPPTLELLTGGGGRHFIFSDPDRRVRKHTPLPGIDILGGGGLFVAPPSVHASGKEYRWSNWPSPPAPVPEWMIRDLG